MLRVFFLQCGQIFWQWYLSFSLDIAKINFVIGLMGDKASAWVEAMNSNIDVSLLTYDDFVALHSVCLTSARPDVSAASPPRDRVTPHWFDHSTLGLPWLTWWGFVSPSSSAIWLCYRTSACVRPIHTVVSQNAKREGGGSQLIMADDKSDGHISVKFCLGFDGVELRGEKCLVSNGISSWTWERIINTSSWQQCWWELFSG